MPAGFITIPVYMYEKGDLDRLKFQPTDCFGSLDASLVLCIIRLVLDIVV